MIRAALLALLLIGPAAAQTARPPAVVPPAAPAKPDKPLGLRLEGTVTLRGPAPVWGVPTLDESGRRLFVPRGAAGVSVLAADGLKPIAEIPDTAGSNAVALDPETLRGFSANALEKTVGGPRGATVTAFDQRTLKVVGSVAVPQPLHILYDPATRQVITVGGDGNISLIDPVKLVVNTTITLDSKRPVAAAVDRRGRLFVALADKDSVAAVDLVSKQVSATWPVPQCRGLSAMLFEAGTFRLVVACRGAQGSAGVAPAPPMAQVLDAYNGKAVAAMSIGGGADAVLFDPATKLLYLPNGVGASVTVYRQTGFNTYEAVESAGTRPMAGVGVVDSRTGRLILATAEFVALAASEPGKPMDVRLLANTFALLVYRRLPID